MHEKLVYITKLKYYVSNVRLNYAGLMRGLIVLFLNLQVSVNEKSHLLDECDKAQIIDITSVFF